MMAARGCAGDDQAAVEAIGEAAVRWAAKWPDSPGEDAEAEKWDSDFATREAPLAGWPQLLAAASRLGVDVAEYRMLGGTEFDAVEPERPPSPARRGRMRDRLIYPADCTTGQRRRYLVKRLLAPGDVGAVIGAPGAGKSQLAPLMAYAVAQGRRIFNLRTKQGRTLYVAAEDFAGMRQRVHALSLQHGDAPDFALVDCDNLNEPSARADLLDAVRFHKPALVTLDTVGAAFAGFDENDSTGMGEVVALARRIAADGTAVVLVHHTAKNGDGSPRGHSVLNGTLDMCLLLEGTKDGTKVVRGNLSKNRNGPCDLNIAFQTDSMVLGQDEDGDDITAPIACEIAGSTVAPMPKLTERETRAFAVMCRLDDGAGADEATWRDACEDERVVASENPKNRRTALAKILSNLIDKGAVRAAGGRLHRTGAFEAAEQPATAAVAATDTVGETK